MFLVILFANIQSLENKVDELHIWISTVIKSTSLLAVFLVKRGLEIKLQRLYSLQGRPLCCAVW